MRVRAGRHAAAPPRGAAASVRPSVGPELRSHHRAGQSSTARGRSSHCGHGGVFFQPSRSRSSRNIARFGL